jgi:hypothetical protein
VAVHLCVCVLASASMVESDASDGSVHSVEQSCSPGRAVSLESSLRSIESLRQQGNTFLKRGASGKAVRCYSRALDSIERLRSTVHGADTSELEETEALLLSNRAAALYNLLRFQEALDDANRCVALRPQWAKAHRRRGQSLLHLGNLEAAADALQTAQQLAQEQWKKELLRDGCDADAIIAAYEKLENNASALANSKPPVPESLPPKPPALQEIETVAVFAALLCDLQAAMFVLPPEPALGLLRNCPVFTITDELGQPFFLTDEDGEQVCSFYFDVDDVKETLEWIRSEDEQLGMRAQIVSVDLPRALRLVADTQRERFERTLRRGLKDGAAAGISACYRSTHTFQFRPSLEAVKTAVHLWRAQEKALRENPESDDHTGNNELDEITVENFNGIPIFQAKGLTVLQNYRQRVPLFFDKNDLDFAWRELRLTAEEAMQSGRQIEHPDVEFNVGVPVPPDEVPEECEVDVGTLEDVLHRMAQAANEGSDEFSVILFVPSRRSTEYLGLPYPLDELHKTDTDAEDSQLSSTDAEENELQSSFAALGAPGSTRTEPEACAPKERSTEASSSLTPAQRKLLLQRLATQRIAKSTLRMRNRTTGTRAAASGASKTSSTMNAANTSAAAAAAAPASDGQSASTTLASEPLTAREIVLRGGDRETVRAYLEARFAQRRKQHQESNSASQ